ncbi:MAG: glucose-1-phosphate thymidylyltransferase [bacterium]|jgi:glucose-1-phosphate thymidylyltransferase|nr:glucose-1-phosphate thymidylyltransferase [bacterium]
MKAIIPCAGRGKRLRPLTFTNSKPLIPIANKPLVLYAIDKLKAVGIEEIGIIVSDNTRDMQDVLGDGKKQGVHISYIPQDHPLGIAHTIKVARTFLGDEPFIMYLGDNLLKQGLEEAVENFHLHRPNGILFVCPTTKPQLYGIAVIENERVVRLIEKPKDPPSNLAAIGIYILDPTIHSIIETLPPSARGEYEITDALQALIDSGGRLEHFSLDGWWIDAGNPDDMVEANRLVLQDLVPTMQGQIDERTELRGTIAIGKGTIIENSAIRGPVLIGENCEIRNSFIGSFTSIGANTKVMNSEIEYSVIMENCEIRHIEQRIDNSILGRNVKVTKTDRRPKSYKLVLSDESAAELR